MENTWVEFIKTAIYVGLWIGIFWWLYKHPMPFRVVTKVERTDLRTTLVD